MHRLSVDVVELTGRQERDSVSAFQVGLSLETEDVQESEHVLHGRFSAVCGLFGLFGVVSCEMVPADVGDAIVSVVGVNVERLCEGLVQDGTDADDAIEVVVHFEDKERGLWRNVTGDGRGTSVGGSRRGELLQKGSIFGQGGGIEAGAHEQMSPLSRAHLSLEALVELFLEGRIGHVDHSCCVLQWLRRFVKERHLLRVLRVLWLLLCLLLCLPLPLHGVFHHLHDLFIHVHGFLPRHGRLHPLHLSCCCCCCCWWLRLRLWKER